MVPNGWKLTSLGEVCSGKLQTGPFGSQLHADEYTDEGIPVLMPKDIINFRANTAIAAKIPEYRANDLKKHYLKSGDLLFSRRGDVTRFALIEKDTPKSICGTGCLKAIPNKAHSALFLSYFLQKDAVKKWLEQNAVGQTMPNMNTTILSELPLMVASSRDEEDKIAKILSTWDKAIATTERLIATSQQQKKALMQQLLTGKKRLVNPDTGMVFEGDWEDVNLSSLAKSGKKNFTDGDWIESPYITDSGCRLIQTGNIGIGCFKDKNKKYISSDSFDELGCTEVLPGDLLICRLAEPAGRACVVPDLNEDRLLTSVDVTIMKVDNKKSSALFLSYYFYYVDIII